MTTGRRPNGLCGAAILVAAKIHGFKRTTAQIVQVVRVCEETIRKRLDEFKDTNMAQLKLREFEELEEQNSDPFKFAIEEVDYVPKPKFKVPDVSIKAIQQVLDVNDEDLPQI
jgi:transcription factor IIIB subunit 2